MKKKQIVFCLLVLNTLPLHAGIVVRGNDTTLPFGFKTPVHAKVFDRTNGTFYVGLEAGTGETTSGNYAISCATRPSFSSPPKFTGIAKDADSVTLQNQSIEFLALAEQTNAAPVLAIVTQESSPFEQTFVIGLPTDGGYPGQSENLHDASGDNETGGIVGIAAKPTHVFAAVRPNGGDFGAPDSGIALMCLKTTDTSVILEVKDATTGLGGAGISNKALPLDATSVEIKGTSGGNDVTFAGNDDANKVALHYDKVFDRLYIGLRIQTGSAEDDIGKAVVTARIDATANSALILEAIVADGAIDENNDEIIVAKKTDDTAQDLRVKHIRTLHASTGPSYLIVNGGKGTTDEIGNKIRALPLVNDPTDLSKHGLLADVTTFANGVYPNPATNTGELFQDDNDEAVVGNGDLPIAADDEISDIVVVGDAVYVSIAQAASATNDTGIFYSQALFASNGKIIRWTPWTKRAIPFNAFEGTYLSCGVPHAGPITFFDVDAKTGNIWFVEGTTGRTVGITSWTRYGSDTSLITKLNKALACGSFSVLDLDQATRGFLSQTNRYALFGGTNKVVFARTTQATNNTINSPQTVISDFSSAQNFLETELPENAGCVTVLEYGRRLAGSDTNYFFAGTQKGLFTFAGGNGTGFDAVTLSTLNAAPFSGSAWQKITNISGAVVDIKTSGNKLYVLTTQITTDKTNPMKSKLLSFAFANTLATMFANPIILAETGVGIFATVSAFFGIQIIATGDIEGASPENKEQLILATNKGLFKSDANQNLANGIIDANNQTDANWIAIQSTAMFPGIAGIDTPVRYTVWPWSVQDAHEFKSFSRGSIHQLSGTGNIGSTAADIDSFIPTQFNALDTSHYFATLDPIVYFWSDGGRRFFIVKPITDPYNQNKISSLPFDVVSWNMNSNTLLSHPVLQTIQRFFWIKQIGATGLLLTGTEKGVVALE